MVTLIFLESQKDLFHHLTTRFRMPVKQEMTFGLCQETSYAAIMLNPESNFTRREESFPIPLKYIDVTRTTHTSLDVLLEKHIEDYWNVDEDRELSDTWTGFTRFTFLSEKPPDGYNMVQGERLTKKQTTSRPDNVWPEMWKHMSDAAKRKEKQKWAIEKPKLDNAWGLRGIYFIDLEDEVFNDIMKKARRKNSDASSNAL